MGNYHHYYADEMRDNMLELSDRHMLWEVHNNFNEGEYYALCDQAIEKLSQHYHTEFGRYGRSGRHVCVPDTPMNRRHYSYMVAAVKREQDKILKKYR